MIRPHRIGETSAFLGQSCALCKQEFDVGDQIVVCPEDGSRHHVNCWEANNNHCTAYGCTGEGEVGVPQPTMGRSPSPGSPRPPARPRIITQAPEPATRPRTTPPPPGPPRSMPRPAAARPVPNAPGSKMRTLPAGSFGCMRTCLFLGVVAAILATVLLCAGMWQLTSSVARDTGSLPAFQPLLRDVAFMLARV